MQLNNSSIHKLFAIKTLRHTNTSSKLPIVIMKTTHNINHAIYVMHTAVGLGSPKVCYLAAAGLLHVVCSMLHALYFVLDQ